LALQFPLFGPVPSPGQKPKLASVCKDDIRRALHTRPSGTVINRARIVNNSGSLADHDPLEEIIGGIIGVVFVPSCDLTARIVFGRERAGGPVNERVASKAVADPLHVRQRPDVRSESDNDRAKRERD
jgi:hypothetical protein